MKQQNQSTQNQSTQNQSTQNQSTQNQSTQNQSTQNQSPHNKNKVILALSLPIIGGMISQNILNLVDTAMVGQLGSEALASVGLGSFVNFACGAFVIGMAVGIQALVAYMRGAQEGQYASPLNAGLLLSLSVSIPLSTCCIYYADDIMNFLSNQKEIQEQSSIYLQARLLGMMAVGINFCFRSYLSAIEKTKLYLATLLIMHMCNISLNWMLIFGHCGFEARGVQGAGLGTMLSLWLGSVIYIVYACKHFIADGFLKALPSMSNWKRLLQYSISSGIERFFFALGMTTFITFVGWMGTLELAVSHVILNLFLVAILPAMGFGIAASTLVARSLGSKDLAAIQQWRKDVAQWALFTLSTIALIFFLFPQAILSRFITDATPLMMGKQILGIMVFFLPMEALHMVTNQSLLGLGSHRFVMKISFCLQWFVTLPLVYGLGIYCQWGVTAAWVIHFSTRLFQYGIYRYYWGRQIRMLYESHVA